MNILGNSGCKLVIKDGAIVKYASCSDYNVRLLKQAKKQKEFYNENLIKGVYTPKILSVNDCSFKMEYLCYYENFISFLGRSDKSMLDDLTSKIIKIIEQTLAQCKTQKILFNIIEKKFLSINLKQHSSRLFQLFNTFQKNELILPVGKCHGDLTFSNMLFHNNTLALIDFLDCFIETPLQDLVKLRQDTHFYWSLNMVNSSFDYNKITIALDYIDGKLVKFFNTHMFYKNYYTLFQFINLARIIPYCSSKKTETFVINCIEKLF